MLRRNASVMGAHSAQTPGLGVQETPCGRSFVARAPTRLMHTFLSSPRRTSWREHGIHAGSRALVDVRQGGVAIFAEVRDVGEKYVGKVDDLARAHKNTATHAFRVGPH